jgi:hypothetical protein
VTYPDGTAAGITPEVVAGPVATGQLADYVGGGQIYQVTFPVGQVPAQPVTVRYDLRTWIPGTAPTPADPGAVTATLHASVVLRP